MNRPISPWWTIALITSLAYIVLRLADAPWVDARWLVGVLVLCWVLAGVHIINDWERRPVLRLGRYVTTAGPGPVWIEPILHSVLLPVSVQDMARPLTVENVQTHDNVRVTIM